MNRKFISLLGIALVCTLVISIPATSASIKYEKMNGKVIIDNNKFHIEILGNENIPKYSFRHVDEDNTTKYLVQFKRIFEYVDNNTNGYYDTNDTISGEQIALSSMSLEMSDVISSDTHVAFNMTMTPTTGSSVTSIQIVNKLTGENSTGLKFDVIIAGFNFTNSDSNAGLVLAFQLSTTTSDKISKDDGFNSGEESRISFGDIGWFDTKHTATDNDGNITVGMNTGTESGSNMAYLAYEQFNGTLVHDPTVGVQASVVDDTDTNNDGGPELGSDDGLVAVYPVFSLGIVVSVVFLRIHKRNR